MKNKKIIFICTGNTCRSPMAEAIFRFKLKNAGVKDIKVTSAGLMAEDGLKMSQNSFKALKSLGITCYSFRSKRATLEMLNKANLIVCMTFEHKLYLQGVKNVYTIKELTGLNDVSDPYGGSLADYMKTSHEIEDACSIILTRILEKGDLL